MGRHATGWKIRLREGAKTWTVYWWSVEGQRQIELSTGETDSQRAAVAAAKIYTDFTQGKLKSRGVRPGPSVVLTEVAVDWIASMEGQMSQDTLDTYSIYFETHLGPYFQTLSSETLSTANQKSYMSSRLKVVQGSTLRHEMSALRVLAQWAEDQQLVSDLPLILSVPRGALGTPAEGKHRQKPGELYQEEIEAFLGALPVFKKKLGFVRARFTVGFEMFLRWSTLNRLDVPTHWSPGEDYLTIDARTMKGKRESRKLLTDRAKESLESAYEKPGLIFGKHDYRLVVQEAAKALPEHKRSWFIGSHVRSAGATDFLADGASLPAAQYGLDHTLATTTDRYARSLQRSYEAELIRQGKVKRPLKGSKPG